jgi:2-methylisocitrate lyase-like PEP mutase family enzyme
MTNQQKRAKLLRSLHVKGKPLVLFNIWDAGSAMAMQDVGATVIATSSWSVASAHGYKDGEELPFDLVLANLQRIVASVNTPVTIDLEGGYGRNPGQVQQTVAKIIAAGVVGINLEDQIVGGEGLYTCDEQCMRIEAAKEAVTRAAVPVFINARTDIFLRADPKDHNNNHISEALRRASAYKTSGADGFFVPGLQNEELIERLCGLSPLPLNIMISEDGPTLQELIKLGVSRISYGPLPYQHALKALSEAGRKAILASQQA